MKCIKVPVRRVAFPSGVIKSARTTGAWLHAVPSEAKIRCHIQDLFASPWDVCLLPGRASTKHSKREQAYGKLLKNSSLLSSVQLYYPNMKLGLAADGGDEL